MTQPAPPLRFLCLDPRKGKRRMVAAVLDRIGTVEWRRTPHLSARGFPETKRRAEEALAAGTRVPKGRLKTALKLRMLEWQYNGARAFFESNRGVVAAAWNGLNGSRRVFMQAAKDAGAKTLFFELSPFPGCVTVDPAGVNFVNCLPRDAAPYQRWFRESGLPEGRWREASARIRQRAPIAPKEETSGGLPPLTEPFVFVPLQVPGDSQLRLFGGEYRTVEAFIDALEACSAALPPGWHLRIKEHPTSPRSFSGRIAALQGRLPVYLDNATETFEQVRASRAVLTINSSVGLEAMFFDKPVIACGQCFWAIPGIAHAAPDRPALTALLRGAEDLDYSPDAREAFLSFLTQVYYPRLALFETPGPETAAEAAKVTDRLAGTGAFGVLGGEGPGKSVDSE